MLRVVLPTADIVREFRGYEPIFCFYEDGIRGVVRDSVLLSNGMYEHELDECISHQSSLIETFINRVVEEYENSIHRRYIENTYAKNSPSITLELVVAQINSMVNTMTRALFMLRAYEICKSRWQWVGDDLIAVVQFLDDPYDSR